ncbi:uncharacterized protein LOC118488849 [Helianthus annuus]|uniref:uncharacterized protein LOC118488849 n=1 Tax=Helianthus annuus TaxID=4232 RepID=UPI0016530DE5|nr:uncharacterized protein LOC118488849 [Helianthus annuus]
MGDGEGTSVTLISKLDIGNPLYLHPSDSSALTIVSIKLKGTENYSVWSSAMKLALEAKYKFGFINGKCEKPNDDDVLAAQWDRCNSVVLTWLLNSVFEELFLGQVFSKLASEVWTDLKETYDMVDGSVVYDLYKRINCISQSGSSVAEYYNKLTTMWKQFDAMVHLPSCSCQAAKDYNDFSTLIKLMQFLMGLDDVYQHVRTNLLTREPFPSVKAAYALISKEQSHRLSSSGSKSQSVSYVAKSNQSNQNTSRRNFRGPNSNLKCTHCNMLGHTVDRCFEIIGYPPGMKKRTSGSFVRNNTGNNTNRSNVSSGPSSSAMSALPFTPKQIAKLMSLVGDKFEGDQEKSNMGRMSACVSEFVSCSSSVSFNHDYNWVVDSGANQHMIKSDKDMFNCIDVSECGLKVGHPNGTSVSVLKIGELRLINNVVIKDVFYVPGYSVNLLSVHKLAKDNKIAVLFNENNCKDGNSVNLCFNSVIRSNLWHIRLSSSVLNGKSPYELVFNFKPSLSHLRNFGCLCFSTILNEPDKFAYHADKCILIGYSNVKKGYKLWSLDERKVFYSRDVKFYEHVYPFKSKQINDNVVHDKSLNLLNFFDIYETNTPEVSSIPDDEEGATESHDTVSDDQQPAPSASATPGQTDLGHSLESSVESSDREESGEAEDTAVLEDEINPSEGTLVGLRRSSRNVSIPKKIQDYVFNCSVKYDINKEVSYACLSADNVSFISYLSKSTEPSSYSEASRDPKWVEAMNLEMEALLRNQTWELVDLPNDRKPIGSKWIYKIKYKANGEIERYKARSVAKGYNQQEGLDFGETFSPVVKMVTVRCVLSLAVQNNWTLYQLDVNNAFLYGSISEDVYMSLPEGYYAKNESEVCKLVKSLYGLKQAPRKWNEKLTDVLVNVGFVQSSCDHSLYVLSKSSVFIVLLVYVDDIVITGNNDSEITKTKNLHSNSFKIKDLGV